MFFPSDTFSKIFTDQVGLCLLLTGIAILFDFAYFYPVLRYSSRKIHIYIYIYIVIFADNKDL